ETSPARRSSAGRRPSGRDRSQLSSAAHPSHQAFHMLEGRLRQDAMAEIEDMRAGLESLEDALDVLVETGAAGDQRQRVEIALQGEAFGQRGDGDPWLDARVEADRVDFSDACEFSQLRPRAARKGDDPRVRRLGLNLG